MADKYIGTSGWAYKDWGDKFFPKGLPPREQLAYLAGCFNSVEINASFYRLQPKRNFQKWLDDTPDGFKFAIKVSRFITHRKQPIDITEPWRRIIEPASTLGQKLGPFLFQFPPSAAFGQDWLEWLDDAVPKIRRTYAGAELAFEFRHPDCFRPAVMQKVRRYRLALVIANSARFPTAPNSGWAEFAYFRFHGPKKLFASDYDEQQLKPWVGRAAEELDRGKTVYAYFNNDYNAYAPDNARLFAALLG